MSAFIIETNSPGSFSLQLLSIDTQPRSQFQLNISAKKPPRKLQRHDKSESGPVWPGRGEREGGGKIFYLIRSGQFPQNIFSENYRI